MMRYAFISLYSCFRVHIAALSQASSTYLPEREVVLPGSSQALPQLLDALPVTYPFEGPCTEKRHDTAKSFGSIPMVKRWLQTVIGRGDKKVLHQPEQSSKEPVGPANPQSHSNSPARGSAANKKPSRMAAAQRMPVSVLFFGGQMMCGVSDYLSMSANGRKNRL